MSEVLRYERVIDGPPVVVFEAFTTPGGQVAFYGQDDPGWIVESTCELRVGGEWAVTFGPRRDHLYRHRHVFEVIDAPGRLLMSTTEFRVDGSKINYTTEITFTEHHGQTRMSLTQTGFPTTGLRDEHTLGAPNAFTRLERYLRTRAAPAAEHLHHASAQPDRRTAP